MKIRFTHYLDFISTTALLLFTPFAHATVAPQNFVLVSDVDDTMKITHVKSLKDAVINGIFHSRAFTGMSTLYQQMMGESRAAAPGTNGFFVATGGPQILSFKTHSLINVNHFPKPEKIYYRRLPFETDIRAYKLRATKEIAARTPAPMILIGDDTEKDPEAYDDFRKLHPERVLKIYIHRVTGRPIPAGESEFVTAFDIATEEVQDGRLTPDEAVLVAKTIRDEKNPRHFFPSYELCPDWGSQPDEEVGIEWNREGSPNLESYASEIRNLIRHECRIEN